MEDARPVRLIYIAGYGRSGTTLLDIALGEHAAIMGAGEVTTLARHVWDNNEYCACGLPVRECAVWRETVDRWQARDGGASGGMAAYRRTQEQGEAMLAPARLGWRLFGGAGRRLYARRTVSLFRAIADVSGRPVVVDSSKLPGRAFALARLPGIELYIVHVVRDGRGVAWSLTKPYERNVADGVQRALRPKPLVYVAFRWATVNLATEWLCRIVGPGRSIRVRYEDFVGDPAATLRRIVAMTGETPVAATAASDGGRIVSPQHQVAGSRHRMQKAIRFRSDDGWRRQMPAGQYRLFSWLCAPLLRRYGYPLARAA